MTIGFYLPYRSVIDGASCVLCWTGTGKPTSNGKTGMMSQIWLLRADVHPVQASKEGRDASICGACPRRHSLDGDCYVVLAQAPGAVYRAYQDGRYALLDLENPRHVARITRRPVRIGAYGDPGSVPSPVWGAIWGVLASYGVRHTAYTHLWRQRPDLRSWAQASCDSMPEALEALQRGFSPFTGLPRKPVSSQPLRICPSVKGLTCVQCLQCKGAGKDEAKKGIYIINHGARSAVAAK